MSKKTASATGPFKRAAALTAVALSLFASRAGATSMAEFDKMSPTEGTPFIAKLGKAMADAVRTADPKNGQKRAQDTEDYFSKLSLATHEIDGVSRIIIAEVGAKNADIERRKIPGKSLYKDDPNMMQKLAALVANKDLGDHLHYIGKDKDGKDIYEEEQATVAQAGSVAAKPVAAPTSQPTTPVTSAAPVSSVASVVPTPSP